MLYGFRHYITPDGRRVECAITVEEYERAVSRVPAGYFDGVALTPDGDTVRLTMTIGAAIRLADALAGVGGEASVVARMLSDQLDGMAAELARISPNAPRGHQREYLAAVGF